LIFGTAFLVYLAVIVYKLRKAYLLLQETNRIEEDENSKRKAYIEKIKTIEKTFVKISGVSIDKSIASHVLSGEISHLKDRNPSSTKVDKDRNL